MSLPNPPSGNYLKWVIEHPEQVAAYLETVRALENLRISVTYAATTPTGTRQFAVKIGSNSSVIEIVV
jgi:hypothetical protein